MSEPDPTISIQYVGNVLQLICEGDLVDSVKLILHSFMVKGISFQSLYHVLFVPLRK